MIKVSEWSVFIIAFCLYLILSTAIGQELSGNSRAAAPALDSSPLRSACEGNQRLSERGRLPER